MATCVPVVYQARPSPRWKALRSGRRGLDYSVPAAVTTGIHWLYTYVYAQSCTHTMGFTCSLLLNVTMKLPNFRTERCTIQFNLSSSGPTQTVWVTYKCMQHPWALGRVPDLCLLNPHRSMEWRESSPYETVSSCRNVERISTCYFNLDKITVH